MRAAGRLLLSRGGGPPATSIHRTIIISSRRSNSSSASSTTTTDAATDAAAAAAAAAAAVPRAIWLPLPRLAPHMTTGRVQAWLKGEGEPVACYEVIAEVASDNLVEAAHRVGRFVGEVPLLLEAQEDGFVARILRPAEKEKGGGLLLRVGTPIAVLCEEEEEVDPIIQGLASLPPSTLGHLDLYHPEAQRLLRICNWQAYLKEPPPEGDGRCGCG